MKNQPMILNSYVIILNYTEQIVMSVIDRIKILVIIIIMIIDIEKTSFCK